MEQEIHTLSYNDVEDMFYCNSIWTARVELYWFRHAWSLLEEHGMTSYSNQKERYKVMLYAVALIDTYWRFCYLACGESYDSDLYGVYAVDFIPEVIIGQMAEYILHEDDVFENANEALCSMLPDLKYHVFQAIDEFDACVWMYSTVFGPPKKLFGEQKSYDIRSYEDFAKMVDEIYEDVGGEIEIAYGCFNRGWSLSDWIFC